MHKIAVIGLGYVGLPISLTISKNYETLGYDINKIRISQLRKNIDNNNEFEKRDFLNKKIKFTTNIKDLSKCNVYIICVPTPVKKNKIPDLNPVEKSFNIISKVIKKHDIVILESTVYPGITKKYSKSLEQKTGLKNNLDFHICYSPERINPGDKKNSLTKINKIIAYEGKNLKIKKKIINIYSKLSKKLIFINKINETETAKAIENIQRDLNIALYNEILLICTKLNLNFNEVIKLAKTKWNFLKFSPGLVGGHCLPVDPYYLTYSARKKKYNPRVTLSGRYINHYMKKYVLQVTKKKMKMKKNLKICVFGLTYKYGVSDTRNSQKIEIYKDLKKKYLKTTAYDPFIKDKNFNNKLNYKNCDYYLFLTKGKIFQKIYNKLDKRKRLDPFFYYSN